MPDSENIWLTVTLLVLIHVLAGGLIWSIVAVSHRPVRARRAPATAPDSAPR